MLDLLKRQTGQIQLLVLQNKRLEDRLRAVETHLQIAGPETSTVASSVHADTRAQQPLLKPTQAVRGKKKASQSLAATWFEWFTADPRVFVSSSVKKSTLYEFRHAVGFMMVFLPSVFMLNATSPAYNAEVLSVGEQAQGNTLDFVRANGLSAVATGTVIKLLRELHKKGKLDTQITRFHELVDVGKIVDLTPTAAHAPFIRLRPSVEDLCHHCVVVSRTGSNRIRSKSNQFANKHRPISRYLSV